MPIEYGILPPNFLRVLFGEFHPVTRAPVTAHLAGQSADAIRLLTLEVSGAIETTSPALPKTQKRQ